MRIGEAEIGVVADGGEFNRQMARMMDDTRRRWRKFSRDNAEDTKTWRDANGKLRDEFGRFIAEGNRGFLNLGIGAGSFGKVLRGLVGGFARVAAGATAIGSIIGILGAATASAIQFAAALAPAAGAVAALPAVIGVLAGAVATLQVALAGVGDAFAAAASGDTAEFNDAIAGLAPNAQNAARALREITPGFQALQQSVQNAFFTGFDDTLRSISATLLGPLTAGMTAAASGLAGLTTRIGEAVTSGAGVAFIESSFAALANIIANLTEPVGALIEAFASLGSSINLAFGGEAAGAGLANLITRFADFINTAADSGAAIGWVEGAMTVFSQLGDIIGEVVGIIGTVGSVAQTTGGNILGAFGSALASVNAFLSSAQGIATLTTIFETLNSVGALFGDVLAGLLPVVAPLVGELVSGLMPVLQSLVPILVQIGSLAAPIFSQILAAVLPLLPPLLSLVSAILPLVAQLLTSVVTALAPLLEAFTTLLVSILTPLIPALEPLLIIFGELAIALSEILTPVIQLVGDILLWVVNEVIVPFVIPIIEVLAGLFSGLLTEAVQGFADLFAVVVNGIAAAAQWVWGQLQTQFNAMKLGFQILGQAFQTAGNFIKNNVFTPLKNAASSVKSALASTWNSVKSAFQSVVNKFSSGVSKIKTALSSIWTAVKGAYNALASGWNRIDIEIGPFSIPDWVPGIGGATFHIADIIPDIPRLAVGGFTGAGSPLARLDPNEMVLPLDHQNGINALADALARASSMTAGLGMGGNMEIRVFIGDRELTDIIDVQIEEHDDDVAHDARVGAGTR
jgi:phage-related protein